MSARANTAKANCDALWTWLRLNLGRRALAALTGTDVKALAAAVHILRLHAYSGHDALLSALRTRRVGDAALDASVRVSHDRVRVRMAFPRSWGELAGLPPYERIWILAGSPEKRRPTAGVEGGCGE